MHHLTYIHFRSAFIFEWSIFNSFILTFFDIYEIKVLKSWNDCLPVFDEFTRFHQYLSECYSHFVITVTPGTNLGEPLVEEISLNFYQIYQGFRGVFWWPQSSWTFLVTIMNNFKCLERIECKWRRGMYLKLSLHFSYVIDLVVIL